MKYGQILAQYAAKGQSMTLEEALHYITEMYMEQCGISISLRTVIYEAGEKLYDLLLENPAWQEKEEIYLFRAMRFFHEDYTLEMYEDYDITSLSKTDWIECCEMVMEELCSEIDAEKQVAIPYKEASCEQKLQAFCWGTSLVLLNFQFWVEASGTIERYFKRYNVYPLPDTLAAKILNLNKDSMILSYEDLVHYKRSIADIWFEKMMLGILSEEIYQKVIQAVEDYSTFMESVNQINEVPIHGHNYSVKQAIYIIENIYRAHEEDGFNELIPSWDKALHECVATLKDATKSETVEDYIEYGEYLLDVMPLLQLHPFKKEGNDIAVGTNAL